MKKKKIKTHLNRYCLWILSLIIVSGCASQSKKDQIVEIQKTRIHKLEKQLAAKNQIIEKIKVDKWAEAPSQIPESLALKPLREKVKKRQWVAALKLSSQLKQKYPSSMKLIKYRIAIFRKMGLRKQAEYEMDLYKKKMASRKGKSSKN